MQPSLLLFCMSLFVCLVCFMHGVCACVCGCVCMCCLLCSASSSAARLPTQIFATVNSQERCNADSSAAWLHPPASSSRRMPIGIAAAQGVGHLHSLSHSLPPLSLSLSKPYPLTQVHPSLSLCSHFRFRRRVAHICQMVHAFATRVNSNNNKNDNKERN